MPPITSAIPSRRGQPIPTWRTPSTRPGRRSPRRSAVRVTSVAVTPPAPSERTVISETVTTAAPARPPIAYSGRNSRDPIAGRGRRTRAAAPPTSTNEISRLTNAAPDVPHVAGEQPRWPAAAGRRDRRRASVHDRTRARGPWLCAFSAATRLPASAPDEASARLPPLRCRGRQPADVPRTSQRRCARSSRRSRRSSAAPARDGEHEAADWIARAARGGRMRGGDRRGAVPRRLRAAARRPGRGRARSPGVGGARPVGRASSAAAVAAAVAAAIADDVSNGPRLCAARTVKPKTDVERGRRVRRPDGRADARRARPPRRRADRR